MLVRKFVIAFAAMVSLTSFLPAVAAAAQGDPVMCTLEKKGLVHSPVGSFCDDDPWDA
jgi:hypothetical protein